MVEHLLDGGELQKSLGSDFENGLTSAEVKMRQERDGPNALTPPVPIWWYWKLHTHIASGFAILLWVGSFLCLAIFGVNESEGIPDTPDLVLGIVLALVVLGTGIFAWHEECKSDAVLAGFMKLSPSTCDVKRDGVFTTISAIELVVGDIIRVQFGKKIPADIIILESAGIKVDNSSLTGESEPLKRSRGQSDTSAWRSKNVAFFGTNCVEGTGTAVVCRIGDGTAIGSIASNVGDSKKPDPLMKAEIERFVHFITYIAIFLGVLFLILAVIPQVGGSNIKEAIIFCIAIIVANVPEGLLATLTVAMTITAKRMATKNVLVKSNLIVETLGSITAIASDKTGTLTQNRMTVRNVIFPDGLINVAKHVRRRSFVDYKKVQVSDLPGGLQVLPQLLPYYTELVKCAGLCNHASFDERETDILMRRTNGDASENALLKFSHSNGDVDLLKKEFVEIGCIPFNSVNKFMVTIHSTASTAEKGEYLLYMKGAPERVMERCSKYKCTVSGETSSLDEAMSRKISDSNSELAMNGERVLAFAKYVVTGLAPDFVFLTDDINNLNFDINNFEFLGMISLEDPPRVEVPSAIECCHEAGIKVIMVTGDHPLTARSIASQIGILTPADGGKNARVWDPELPAEVRRDEKSTGVVVTGNDLAGLDAADWAYILSRNGIVFARTLPIQKQDIVAKLQERDEVVAVTGDGVNDSPALKKADVGVAMGTGSDIAKEAADLILLDDNFASIVKGIEEGRLIFSNLKKSIAYTLTSNIPEIVPFLAQIVIQLPLSLTTIMILCIDLGTDLLPAISFAYEKAESDIMKKPPRNRHKDKLVTGNLISWSYLQIGIIQSFAAFTTYFYVLHNWGFSSSFILSEHFRGNQLGAKWYMKVSEDSEICFFNSHEGSGPRADSFPTWAQSGGLYGGDYCATEHYRSTALAHAQTAFLAAIVTCQIGCGISCRTRLNSIVKQGLFTNRVFCCGVFQEIVLIALLVYAPFLQYIFGTHPMGVGEWLIPVPFSVFIILYDEIRRWLFRNYPDSTFTKMSFF
jgi:sodium/potassium-transporting ATPase subunit alpha